MLILNCASLFFRLEVNFLFVRKKYNIGISFNKKL